MGENESHDIVRVQHLPQTYSLRPTIIVTFTKRIVTNGFHFQFSK